MEKAEDYSLHAELIQLINTIRKRKIFSIQSVSLFFCVHYNNFLTLVFTL